MEIESKIINILDQYPNLNYFGFGLINNGKGLTESQQKLELKKLQDELFANIEQIEHVINWLDDVDEIRSFNENRSSYRLKHLAEKTAPNNYVANGSFIVGAILSNFRVKMDRPNAYFNMSEKSLKLKVEEIDRLKKTKQVISHVMQ